MYMGCDCQAKPLGFVNPHRSGGRRRLMGLGAGRVDLGLMSYAQAAASAYMPEIIQAFNMASGSTAPGGNTCFGFGHNGTAYSVCIPGPAASIPVPQTPLVIPAPLPVSANPPPAPLPASILQMQTQAATAAMLQPTTTSAQSYTPATVSQGSPDASVTPIAAPTDSITPPTGDSSPLIWFALALGALAILKR